MRLTRILVENFRGIRRLDVALDVVTVVIGENNHGKTSLFDLLELCLGRAGDGRPGRLRIHDFHRGAGGDLSPVGPIRVILTFEPDDPDGALAPAEAALEEALRVDQDGRRRLRAEYTGRAAGEEIVGCFVDEEHRPLRPQPSEEVMVQLRRLHPVLVVRFSHRPDGEVRTDEHGTGRSRTDQPTPGSAEAEIAYVYRELASARGPVSAETLRRGLSAARRLYEGIRERNPSGHGPLRRMLDQLSSEGVGHGGRHVGGSGPVPMGGGSHTLSLLMVLGALLEVRGEERLSPAAHPLLAIEEPEVHLHPILLASTWDVIESIQAQTLITTNSGEFLSKVPLRYLRRLARRKGRIEAHQLRLADFTPEDRRRIGYHIRAKRGGVLFARCWMLVEGESEFWLMRQLAEVLGYDLDAEGVRCVEFAQCGVAPIIKLADHLGLAWHLMADGADAGGGYVREALEHLRGRPRNEHVTRLREHDIERHLWRHGYAGIYLKAAGTPESRSRGHPSRKPHPGRVIARAIRAHSKPYLALSVAEACAARGPESVPHALRMVIERSVALARGAVDVGAPPLLSGVPNASPLTGIQGEEVGDIRETGDLRGGFGRGRDET